MLKTSRKPNHLIDETSPYLLQHAHNPVDWYPWGDEAFQKAKEEDKPILLSCGYSACHWCHVMERESFENEEIAELMNRYFINIKVDREERPDLDQIYQQAVQLITGQGGWPLTVFLDTSGRPFFGGTYFPPEPMYGRMSFPKVLETIHDKWVNERNRIEESGGQLLEYLQSASKTQAQQSAWDPELPLRAVSELAGIMDRRLGGFGMAPKFPNFNLLQFFLRVGNQHRKDTYINLATFTLKQMALGGIHDQLGGGFHRYSTDPRWLVPHFEKMLYDNAQLIKTYTTAYQIKPDEEFKMVVKAAADFIRREMTAPEGAFYATLDADSEGEEGRYYLWRREEIRELLPDDVAQVFIDYYSVTDAGNFEGKNIFNRLLEDDETRLTPETQKKISQGKAILLAAREKREKPFRDEKIITGWNGLMIGALASSYQIFQNPLDYRSAKTAAEFLLKTLRTEDGSLAGVYKDGRAKIKGYLDDYAFLAQGLIDLYEADFNRSWLENSLALTKAACGKFGTPGGRYYLTEDTEDLIARPLSGSDQAIPAGVAVHCENSLRLAAFTGERELWEEARKILGNYQAEMADNVWGHAGLISALDIYHENYKTFSFISDQSATPEILVKLRKSRLPYHIIAWHNTALGGVETHPARELFSNRETINGKPACYLCYDQHCLPPVTEWEDLSAILGQII